MGLYKALLYFFASVFYRVAALIGVRADKDLKSHFDEFWSSVTHCLEGTGTVAFGAASREMIEGVYDLRETRVREVMVPRNDVVAVRVNDTVDRVVALIQKEGRSRIPVFAESIDNIVGVLYAKDVLKDVGLSSQKEFSIEKNMRPVHFVPETKNVFDLLQEMKRKKVHLAIVIDEFGGTAGLVTMEDVIEEIIGEVQDEYDNEEEPIVSLDTNVWLVDARQTIDTINERLDIAVPSSEDYDTLAGFIMCTLGRIPQYKEKISHENMQFIVAESDEKSIAKVKIIVHTDSEHEKDEGSHE